MKLSPVEATRTWVRFPDRLTLQYEILVAFLWEYYEKMGNFLNWRYKFVSTYLLARWRCSTWDKIKCPAGYFSRVWSPLMFSIHKWIPRQKFSTVSYRWKLKTLRIRQFVCLDPCWVCSWTFLFLKFHCGYLRTYATKGCRSARLDHSSLY